MNCHLVPQVYLKQWKIPATSNGIYIFDKNAVFETGVQRNIYKLRDTSFAFENYYVLDEANSFHDFALGNMSELTEKEKYTIETDYFANKVENNWEFFINYINTTLVNKRVIKTIEKFKNEFIEFFAIQFFRRAENFRWLIMDNILDEIDKMIIDGKLSADDRDNATMSLFFNALLKQARGESNHINTMIDSFGKEFQIMFLFAHRSTAFITSDNPCFYHNAQGNKCNGTYMPLNKKICAYLVKPKVVQESKYLIVDISENNTKYINHLISNYAITSLAYDSVDMGSLFDTTFNDSDWVSSMKRVLLS